MAAAASLLATCAVLLPSGSASAGERSALPRQADRPSTERVTFGLGPGGQTYIDKRAFLSYAGSPGSQLLDHVAVYNQSNRPLDLLVYPSDAANTRTGAIDLKPRSVQNVDLGAWVALGAAATTGRPARDGRSMVRVRVPAQSPTKGIGRVLVPMNLIVPRDATPGDHSAGIVAALLSVGKSAGAQNIELEQRVALKVYFRVAGELKPSLAVKIIRAEYLGGSGLGLQGITRVRYQVRNTGNVRLGALTTVDVRSSFGLGTRSVVGPKLDDVVPGGSVVLSTDVTGTPPSILQHAQVRVRAKAAVGNRPVNVKPATDQARLWAITWQEIVLLIVLSLLLVWFGSRRRRRTNPPRRGRQAAEPRVGASTMTAGAAVVVFVTLVLGAATASQARAADLGTLGVSPKAGSNATLFFGYAETTCPKGTTDSYWTIDGPDLPRDTAFLAPGNTTGTGPQQFRGASLANVRTEYPDSFRRDGTYVIRFSCVPLDGRVRDSYQIPMRYRVAGNGSWEVGGAHEVPDFVFDPSIPSPAPSLSPRATPAPSSSPVQDEIARPGASPGRSASPAAAPTAAALVTATPTAPAASRGSEPRRSWGLWLAGLAVLPLGVGAWALRRGRAT